MSFAAIADIIGCSPDTISKEIRKHRYFKERTKTAGNYNRVNDCKYKDKCQKKKSVQNENGKSEPEVSFAFNFFKILDK